MNTTDEITFYIQYQDYEDMYKKLKDEADQILKQYIIQNQDTDPWTYFE